MLDRPIIWGKCDVYLECFAAYVRGFTVGDYSDSVRCTVLPPR